MRRRRTVAQPDGPRSLPRGVGLPTEPRHLVQVAAVIGREFPVRVLERVAEREGIQEDLAVLLRADLIREVRRYPELECRFRHGLIGEAALQTLTPDRLRELN